MIADAPAVKRRDPIYVEAVKNNLNVFGYQQILRTPLEEVVQQSRELPIKYLATLIAVDQDLVREWDAWSDNISQVCVLIAQDLWDQVDRCEREIGVEETWGHHAHYDGVLFDRLAEMWRFRDIPIDRFERCQIEELIAWENSLTKLPPNRPAASNYSDWIDVVEFISILRLNKLGKSDRTIARKKKEWSAERKAGTNGRTFRFDSSLLRSLGIQYPPEWDK